MKYELRNAREDRSRSASCERSLDAHSSCRGVGDGDGSACATCAFHFGSSSPSSCDAEARPCKEVQIIGGRADDVSREKNQREGERKNFANFRKARSRADVRDQRLTYQSACRDQTIRMAGQGRLDLSKSRKLSRRAMFQNVWISKFEKHER